MTTPSTRTICATCQKEKITYPCDGCSQRFCFDHLAEHRKNLGQQFDQIENDHDQIRQNLNEQKIDSTKHHFIKQINQWEKDSIDKIKQTAQQCREKLINSSNEYLLKIEKNLNDFGEKMKKMRHENEFNEIDLNHLKQILQKMKEECLHSPNISIRQQSTSFIDNISVLTPLNTRWKQLGITIAGGNGQGNELNQLSQPFGICIDDQDQTTYIADFHNHRIVEWKVNATNGRIVAGGNGQESQTNQLNSPTNVIIDRENNSIIITDTANRRVMRRSRQTSSHGEIITSNIYCWGLTMHKDGSLYVSDYDKNEVRRWKKGETNGTIVAGGNGQGNQLNQLHHPMSIFVDDDHALYISDQYNHRVMKWVKDAKEGIVVAGGNGAGVGVTQLFSPQGVVVDQFGQIYVADCGNDRVMRWCEGAKEGTIVVGGKGDGEQANQLTRPTGLLFDGEGNLYVADHGNHRIQKFLID